MAEDSERTWGSCGRGQVRLTPEEIIGVLADDPGYYPKPLPPGVEKRDYSRRSLPELNDDVTELYRIKSLFIKENERLKTAAVETAKYVIKLKWIAGLGFSFGTSCLMLLVWFGKVVMPYVLLGLKR